MASRPLLLLPLMLLLGCPRATCPQTAEPAPQVLQDDPGRVVAEPDDAIAFLYDQAEFRTFELLLADQDLATLDADPAAERYVPATLVFGGTEYPVAVRYKGQYGAWVGCTDAADEDPLAVGGARTCAKLNLKVSFNEDDPDGRFFGVKKLLFHAMNADDSLMRERLGYQLFRQMGVPAPRAVHVRLLINGELAGLFLNVEYIDGRFTRSRFEDGEGNLFKEIWPTASPLQYELSREWLLEALRTNEDESPSMDRMLRYSEAVGAKDGDERAAAIASWMSVDNTSRFIAVDRTIRADDGPFHFYCSGERCANHNVYLYEEQDADRVWLIPWDLDHAFVVVRDETWLTSDTYVKVMDAVADAHRQMPPSCDPLIGGLGCWFHGSYEAAVDELLEGPFSTGEVEGTLAAWEGQIADVVQEASDTDADQLTPELWQAGLEELRARVEIVREQANGARGR